MAVYKAATMLPEPWPAKKLRLQILFVLRMSPAEQPFTPA
jgi:hypothetical protein